LRGLEADPNVLTAGLATVQPWLDIPELGSGVLVVTTEDNLPRGRPLCAALAESVWNHRIDYVPGLVSVSDAVRTAHEHRGGLVVLSDSADATTSGAPGDSTWLLREFLNYDWPRPVLLPLVAPELVREAARRGPGAEWAVAVGGLRDSRFSQPVNLTVHVQGLFEARFVMSGHLARNLPIDMGPSVLLRHGNIHLLVTSRTGPHFAPDFFRAAGLDPFAAGVLVAKSPCGFRAAYADRADRILVVRAPGCAPSDFWNYDYKQISRPLWPWDEIGHWSPAPVLYRRALD
jgi:microcystin degradation protein MlrC